MEQHLRFQDRVAIITGAASGIGLATAQRISSEGGRVAMVDMNEDKLAAAKKSFPADIAKNILTLRCDVSKEEQIADAVHTTMVNFGALDIVVNCAGLMIFKKLEEHTTQDWHKVLGVDLMGTFHFTRQAFLNMKNGGTIVNVSSIHAVETTPLVASYAAAKAAILSLTRSAAIEGKPRGIRVNAVIPGAVDTPMLWQNPNIKAGLEVIHKSDVGTADNIAAAIAYLASDDSKFIQGTSLQIDGGRLVRL